jgi:hypothetical protein
MCVSCCVWPAACGLLRVAKGQRVWRLWGLTGAGDEQHAELQAAESRHKDACPLAGRLSGPCRNPSGGNVTCG